MRDVALAQTNSARPASLQDVIKFMFNKPLDYTPYDFSPGGLKPFKSLATPIMAMSC
ncbi:hypothetical protein K432DRAFT_385054 [Lepidopterella palustris CBS 459.81]|uniref:Uncharacterized protein n=1 Tax=Lepidopterella palustris CBS 459.81 TaxID=1314670 RepID=A0A8E2JC05_9PEZI|nr:hypothetical protein K432DRAFT_385054 [Lepidopterella palustris CBS 459.81]